MKIIVDAFGGDNAPAEIIKGAIAATQEREDLQIILTGPSSQIHNCVKMNSLDLGDIEVRDAKSIIPVDVDPFKIRHEYNESSMAIGLKMLAEDEGDAFVSAGSTGAVGVGANLFVKRIKGVRKPAIGTIVPGKKGPVLLMDCGANDNCFPDVLNFFGLMGSIYMEKVMGVENPKVGLANIGVEPNKGTDLQRGAYEVMEKNDKINFMGNCEVRDILFNAADVVIADGFTGNIILKTMEGVAKMLLGSLKDIYLSSAVTKLSYLGVRKGMHGLKNQFDTKKIGGAPLIGINKPVIKAHGSSNAEAMKNAIFQAASYAESGAIDVIRDSIPSKRERISPEANTNES